MREMPGSIPEDNLNEKGSEPADPFEALMNAARNRDRAAELEIITKLRSEERFTLDKILELFKSGDKFAAELLVRTFYFYAENLMIMLESRAAQNRITPQNSLIPSLTFAGSKRAEFLNDFFVNFIFNAKNLDLSSGVKLYIFRTFVEKFDKNNRSEAEKSASREMKALSSSDEYKASASGIYSKSCENIKRAAPVKRISGIPAGRPQYLSEQTKAARVRAEAEHAAEKLQAENFQNKGRTAKRGRNLASGYAKHKMGVSDDGEIHAAPPRPDSKSRAKMPPSIPASSFEFEPAASEAPEAECGEAPVMSRRAEKTANALSELAAEDLQAYYLIMMRYFKKRTFAKMCRDFGVKSSADISLGLLRGFEFLLKNMCLK